MVIELLIPQDNKAIADPAPLFEEFGARVSTHLTSPHGKVQGNFGHSIGVNIVIYIGMVLVGSHYTQEVADLFDLLAVCSAHEELGHFGGYGPGLVAGPVEIRRLGKKLLQGEGYVRGDVDLIAGYLGTTGIRHFCPCVGTLPRKPDRPD